MRKKSETLKRWSATTTSESEICIFPLQSTNSYLVWAVGKVFLGKDLHFVQLFWSSRGLGWPKLNDTDHRSSSIQHFELVVEPAGPSCVLEMFQQLIPSRLAPVVHRDTHTRPRNTPGIHPEEVVDIRVDSELSDRVKWNEKTVVAGRSEMIIIWRERERSEWVSEDGANS